MASVVMNVAIQLGNAFVSTTIWIWNKTTMVATSKPSGMCAWNGCGADVYDDESDYCFTHENMQYGLSCNPNCVAGTSEEKIGRGMVCLMHYRSVVDELAKAKEEIKGWLDTADDRRNHLEMMSQERREFWERCEKAEAMILEFEKKLSIAVEALGYFSCPDCRCGWFRTVDHKDDILECKHCGWRGERRDGQSDRFFKEPAKP